MGIGAGLGTLLAGVVGTAGAIYSNHANASAQSSINQKTMDFNRVEAAKAREFEHQEAAINRLFNQRSANTAMQFGSNEAKIQRAFESSEALKARQFESSEAAITRNFNALEASKERKWSSDQARLARQFNAQESLLAREFEERMANSAHQREVADLRAAGLNPVLSATGGSGAASPVAPVIGSPIPSGAAASAQAAHGHKANGSSAQGVSASGTSAKAIAASVHGLNAYMKKDVLGTLVNSAMDSIRLDNDIKRAKASDLQAQASMKNAETSEYKARWDVQVNNERLGLDKAKAAAEIDKLEADIEIGYEALELQKMETEASVEQKKAIAADAMSHVDVNRQQAALLNMQREELEDKIEYGYVLMSYAPAEMREAMSKHMLNFVKENPELLDKIASVGDGKPDPTLLKYLRDGMVDWAKRKGVIKDSLGHFSNGRVRGAH